MESSAWVDVRSGTFGPHAMLEVATVNRRALPAIQGKKYRTKVGFHFCPISLLCVVSLKIHPLAQLFPGLEVRDVLLRHLHLFPRLGVAPCSRRPVVQAKA